jgi:surfactin synthase thioesterase subunit
MRDWIRVFRPKPDATTRVVCFPHAGGSAGYYREFGVALPPSADFLAVQYPGRQDRFAEPPIDDMHELADQVAERLRPCLDRPTVFFGHSMGATIAYETALRLAATGAPASLFVSGRAAPSRQRPGEAHLLDDDALMAHVRKLSDIDPALLDDPDIRPMIIPALRADYRAVNTYRPEPGRRVDCPVVALIGDADPVVAVADTAAWADHTTGSFERHIFPGGHFYLTDAVPEITRLIVAALA